MRTDLSEARNATAVIVSRIRVVSAGMHVVPAKFLGPETLVVQREGNKKSTDESAGAEASDDPFANLPYADPFADPPPDAAAPTAEVDAAADAELAEAEASLSGAQRQARRAAGDRGVTL